MTVTVFSKPKCPQCDATKRKLVKLDIPHTVIDVSQDERGLARVRELGYEAVPVVEHGDDNWYGYRPDKLDGLIAERRAA